MKIYKLEPVNGQKSFYGKAVVYEYDDGTRVLKSYRTNVAAILPDGTFRRLWYGYSGQRLHCPRGAGRRRQKVVGSAGSRARQYVDARAQRLPPHVRRVNPGGSPDRLRISRRSREPIGF